jgi:sulfoxide reductase catalytic subunit YedY
MKKRNIIMSVLMLTIMLSFALITSCRPILEPINPNQDTGEPASVQLEPSPTDNPTITSSTDDSQANSDKEDKYFNQPRAITSIEELHLTGNPPEEVDIEAYRLDIKGLVDNPLLLTYEDILSYPAVTEVVLLICPSVFEDNAEWTGVPVWAILQDAGIKPGATKVVFKAIKSPVSTSNPRIGSTRYSAALPIEEIIGNDSIFLAYNVNGQILPLEHGYPIRLVAKDSLGFDWVKWVEIIEVR